MKTPRNGYLPSLLLGTVLMLSYFAGYAKIRNDCMKMGSSFHVVPAYFTSSTALRTIYRPCLRLEAHLSGGYFSVSPWGLMFP